MPKLKLSEFDQLNADISLVMKKAMLEKGWTQSHLGKLTGHSQCEISQILRNPLGKKADVLYSVTKKLGVNIFAVEVNN